MPGIEHCMGFALPPKGHENRYALLYLKEKQDKAYKKVTKRQACSGYIKEGRQMLSGKCIGH